MRLAWSNLSPLEKTVAVAAVFELVVFLCVAAVPAVAVGRSYMLYWVVLGPQGREPANSTAEEPHRDEA